MVTDTHVAALQAMLTGNEEKLGHHAIELERIGGHEDYFTLIHHAFHDAVVRRFVQDSTWQPTEVAGFVASVRSQWLDGEQDLDPNLAERLIRAELGDGTPPPLKAETVRGVMLLLTVIIYDEQLDEEGVADVLAQARERANAQPR